MRRPITDDEIAEHLAGFASYGTYVIRPGFDAINLRMVEGRMIEDVVGHMKTQDVKYVVFDLDTYDEAAQEHLCTEVDRFVLRTFEGKAVSDRHCLLYESSGGKGTHVWLFLDKPLPARQVRAWITRDFWPAWVQQPEGIHWPLEVFPKQDSVDEGGFGNLVKLPLGVHAVSGNKSEFLPRQGWASSVEEVVPLDSGLVPQATSGPSPSRPPEVRGVVRDHAAVGPASPFPCIDAIQYDGVGQGNRDNAMFHLALYLFGHGIPEDLAGEQCLRANENFDPPLSDREVRDKVRSAYRGRFASARCGTDWLRDICPGPCRGGWRVLATEDGDLVNAKVGDHVQVEIVRRTNDRGAIRIQVAHEDASNEPTFVVGN